MRQFRLALYFLLGLLLSTVAVFSYAADVAVSQRYTVQSQFYYSPETACAAVAATQGPTYTATSFIVDDGGVTCKINGWLDMRSNSVEYCPTGTLNTNVQPHTCTVQDECPAYSGTATDSLSQNAPANCTCPSGSKWYPFNGCRKTCAWDSGQKVNAGWDMQYQGGGTTCAMGCESIGTGSYLIGKNGLRTGPVESTGWACGAGAPTSPVPPDDTAKIPDAAKHPPLCGSNEGVMTSSSGNVMCLPEGTAGASKPVVDLSKKTETFPDNTTKTTETTKTTDPNTQATDTRTTTTSTGGQSGTAGTSTTTSNTGGSTGDGTGNGSGDGSGDEPGQCAKEPNSPMCKKGTVPQKGKFDDAQDGKVTAAKDQLRAKFAEVKSAASSMFSGSLATGGGSLPCPPPITILGKSWTLCFADYSDQLSIIGTFIMLAAAVGAAFIVLRR